MNRLFSMTVLLGLILSGCAQSTQEVAVETITVGLECAYAPFNWTQVEASDTAVAIDEDGAGYCDGYDIQVAQTIASGLGRTLVVKKIGWDGLIPALTNGEIDMIVAGMTDTEERRQSISFSEPYYQSDMVLIVRNDSVYATSTSLQDFNGAAVIAQQNTFHDTVVDQIPSVNHLTPLGSFALLTNSVVNAEADAMVSEYPVALSIVASNPGLSIVQFATGSGFELSFEDTTVSVAVALDATDLVASINEILAGVDAATRNQWMADAIDRQPAE